MSRTILISAALLISLSGACQTLFTFGNHAVSKQEFLQAYNKNNSDSNNPKMSYNDYLDLYERFRLKVQAALDEKLDTSEQQRSETQAFRNQLADTYLKDDASIALLVQEAAVRSLKDIHLTGIYIPIRPGPTDDEVRATELQINEAYQQLKKGRPFDEVARQHQYSDFGFITAFVLPYDAENIAYGTPIGQFSKPLRTQSGFHILRPTEERKAVGKIRVAQILLAFPSKADDYAKKITALRADSVYRALQAGADFSSLAQQLSGDNLSFQVAGQLPAFGLGQYDQAFENAAFALASDSDISKPVKTAFGYHIIKRIQRLPVADNVHDVEWNKTLRQQVEQSDRMKVAQQVLLKNIRRQIKNDAPAETQTSDSAALAYYRAHLEKYNLEFSGQLKEFTQGNLLFSMMQKNVWDAAAADSIGLLKYYHDNQQNYRWENSADALIVTCQKKDQVEAARNSVKVNFPVWKSWAEKSSNWLQIDSGRYELALIPTAERTNFTEGLVTAPVVTGGDGNAAFAYIIKLHPEKEPKTFDDARGAVINDYQTFLENKWMEKLQKMYPVKLNKKVLNSLP